MGVIPLYEFVTGEEGVGTGRDGTMMTEDDMWAAGSSTGPVSALSATLVVDYMCVM